MSTNMIRDAKQFGLFFFYEYMIRIHTTFTKNGPNSSISDIIFIEKP